VAGVALSISIALVGFLVVAAVLRGRERLTLPGKNGVGLEIGHVGAASWP